MQRVLPRLKGGRERYREMRLRARAVVWSDGGARYDGMASERCSQDRAFDLSFTRITTLD